jgi:excisionase family DNA binding protein
MINGMEHPERLLTVPELAEYLAVPTSTIYQWRYLRKGPPGFRIGRHVRYRRSDVDEWIERHVEASKLTTEDHAVLKSRNG